MSNLRRNDPASADQATERDFEADSNASAPVSCPTEVIPSVDPSPPDMSPKTPARKWDAIGETAATGNLDKTIGLDADE
jgi:hypothetical protein